MTGSTSSSRDSGDEIDDPGRDPVGLDPPRDILDAPGQLAEEGAYHPGHRSLDEIQAENRPDEPPTGTSEGGP